MLLTNANIQPMAGAEIPAGYLQVRDGRIHRVGEMADCPAPEPGEPVQDLNGRLVLPGFIDAHCHLGLMADGVGAEGDDLNEETDPATPHLRAIDGVDPFDHCFSEARAAAITCVVVSPGSANPIAGQICALKTAGRWVDRMAVAQPLAIKFALGENPKMVYGGKTQTPYTRMATAAIIREQLSKAERYRLDQQAAGEDSDRDGPEYDARCEALLPLLRGEIRAHFHAHKAYDILSAVRIAREFRLRYTLIHCTEGYLIADILGELKASVVCGPLICARTKPELAGLSLRNCGELLKAGVTVAISTDHPEVPVYFLAASAAVAVTGGLGRTQALEALTVSAAKAVGLEDRVGALRPGLDADFAVWSGDQLALGALPDQVFIAGEQVV